MKKKKLIKNISKNIIYSENLPICDNGLCSTYYFHGVDIGLIGKDDDFKTLDKYVKDWKKQFTIEDDCPAWLYTKDELDTIDTWNNSRYNLVLLLFLHNGGKL